MDRRFIPPSVQRLWADEVRYLHSLWHQGPSPNPNPNLRPIHSTQFKRPRKTKKSETNRSQQSEIEWPVNPMPDPDPDPMGWPEPIRNRNRQPQRSVEDQAKVNASWMQQLVMKSCRDFFMKDASSDDEMSEDEDDEDEEEKKAFEFFLGIFEKDGELRGYYEKNCEKGDFFCLVCGGIRVKLGKMYGNCVGLVQHSTTISKTRKRAAHRGFGRAVCRVLGWNIDRLPNIVLDAGEPLGRTLSKAADLQEDSQKGDASKDIVEISDEDLQKEDAIKEKDNSNGDSMNCIKEKDISTLDNKADEDEDEDEDEELPSDCGRHPEEYNTNNNLIRDNNENHHIFSPSNPPAAEILSPKPDATGWDEIIWAPATTEPMQPPSAEEQARANTAHVQHNSIKVSRDFLAKSDDSSSDDEDDEAKMEKQEAVAVKFFSRLFENDRDLREYYEKNYAKGEFCCLVCGGIGSKTWKRFGDCVGLVQHSKSISNVKGKWAHRAFGRVVCEVLGWDINGN